MTDALYFRNAIQDPHSTVATLLPASGEGSTTLAVASGHGAARFPTSFPFKMALFAVDEDGAPTGAFEVVKATASAGTDQFTVTRAQESTTAIEWAVGTYITHGVTAGIMQALLDGLRAAETELDLKLDTTKIVPLNPELWAQGIRVDAVADSNITLSGEQVLDGVDCTEGMTVLCTGQTDETENVAHVVATSGWTPLTLVDWAATETTYYGMIFSPVTGDTYAGHLFVQTNEGAEDGDDLSWTDLTEVDPDHFGVSLSRLPAFIEAFAGQSAFALLTAILLQVQPSTGVGGATIQYAEYASGKYGLVLNVPTTPTPLILDEASHGVIFGGPMCRKTRAVSNAGTVIGVTDDVIRHTGLTAARTDTLPSAAALAAGTIVGVKDADGSASVTKTITVQRAGSDTVDGATSAVAINAANGYAFYMTNGTNRWMRIG